MNTHSISMPPDAPETDTIPENRQLVLLEEGIEIQHTKAYGIGIDCHSKFIQISVLVKRDLKIYEYRREFSTSWNHICDAKLWAKNVILSFSSPPVDLSIPIHYCIESTSTYHFPVIQSWGGTPCIVNPSIAGATKRKSDVLDAKLLAIHDLTGIWRESFIPPPEVLKLRVLIGERNYHSKMATRTSNRIGNSLLKFGYTPGKDGSVTKSPGIRAFIENQVSDNPSDGWDNIPPEGIPSDIRDVFRDNYARFDRFSDDAKAYTRRSIETAKALSWQYGKSSMPGVEVLHSLCTAPYIGEWSATVWLSIIVTTDRFPNEKALSAYCGLDPSLKISAKHVTSTVRRGGNKELHNMLSSAASNLIRLHREPFGQWGYNLYLQSGRWKKATNAVARRLAVALYHMQRNGETFSYEKYKLAHKVHVIDIPLPELVKINSSFKRYMPILQNSGILSTSEMVDAFQECRLNHTKGLGKNFYRLVREFIDNQQYYMDKAQCSYGEEV